MNNDFVRAVFPKESQRIDSGRCPFCKTIVDESSFKDLVSLKEYKIAGTCQKCQDEIFGF